MPSPTQSQLPFLTHTLRIPKLTLSFCDLRVTFSYLRGLDLVCRKIPAAASVSASIYAYILCLTWVLSEHSVKHPRPDGTHPGQRGLFPTPQKASTWWLSDVLSPPLHAPCRHPMSLTPGIMSSDMVPVFYERSRVKVKRFSWRLQKPWPLRKSRKSEAHRANFLLHNQNVSGKQKASWSFIFLSILLWKSGCFKAKNMILYLR